MDRRADNDTVLGTVQLAPQGVHETARCKSTVVADPMPGLVRIEQFDAGYVEALSGDFRDAVPQVPLLDQLNATTGLVVTNGLRGSGEREQRAIAQQGPAQR